MLIRLLPLLFFAACAPGIQPGWALDTVFVQPAGADVTGVITWQIFAREWGENQASSEHLCAVVFEFSGTASETCGTCTHSWDLSPTFIESDCGAPYDTSEAAFPKLTGLGLAALQVDFADDDPYPGSSVASMVQYDEGDFVAHGWAYPEALDAEQTVEDPTWNATQSFVFWPAFAWEIP